MIDLYSIKPLDMDTLEKAANQTKAIITVDDHFQEGGLGEAVATGLSNTVKVYNLAVKKIPKSGKSAQLLDYEDISARAVIEKVIEILSLSSQT